jgi:hypothetical protein
MLFYILISLKLIKKDKKNEKIDRQKGENNKCQDFYTAKNRKQCC